VLTPANKSSTFPLASMQKASSGAGKGATLESVIPVDGVARGRALFFWFIENRIDERTLHMMYHFESEVVRYAMCFYNKQM